VPAALVGSEHDELARRAGHRDKAAAVIAVSWAEGSRCAVRTAMGRASLITSSIGSLRTADGDGSPAVCIGRPATPSFTRSVA
jgi:hypothetical protein